jgi:hypothetical protein
MIHVLRMMMAAAAVIATPAIADDQPTAGGTPGWVAPAGLPAVAEPVGAQPLRVMLQDQQIWFHGHVTSLYQHRVLRVDRPEGMQAIARLAVQWRPDTDRLVLHTLRLTRGGRANDLLPAVQAVLAQQTLRFSAVRMDGQRSLGLPIAGIAVGDVVELAYTIDRDEPLLGGHHEMVVDAGTRGGIDRLVLAARWDDAMPMAVAGRNLPAPLAQTPGRVRLVTAAPLGESAATRTVEFSDFRQWADVAAIFTPLFAEARRLADDSPIRDEIARIRGASPDPVARASAALALAEGRVQYLYVGLGQGNLRPLSADAVWQRGFADCKGKAALLLALLDGLGIPAEPALVATKDGEELDRRLPNVTGFDHVLVRAEIAGRTYWLDPTREGDGDIAALPVPRFRWALPVRAGAGLEPMVPIRAAGRAMAGRVRNP